MEQEREECTKCGRWRAIAEDRARWRADQTTKIEIRIGRHVQIPPGYGPLPEWSMALCWLKNDLEHVACHMRRRYASDTHIYRARTVFELYTSAHQIGETS